MAEQVPSVDISNDPTLRELAEEVQRTQVPRVLQSDGEDVAIVMPAHPLAASVAGRKTRTTDAFESFRAAAGSWSDVDTDALVAQIYADRKRSSRPPVEL